MKIWFSLVILVLCALWFWHLCSTPKIQSALILEGNGEYASAYQEYASLLVKGARKFELPKPDGNLEPWLESLTRNFISFKADQPTKSDCTVAYSKLRALQNQLNYLEHTFELKTNKLLEKSDFLEAWKLSWYENQKSMPDPAKKTAETAFANHISFAFLKGDYSSHIEGILYNASLDRSFPFLLESGTDSGFEVLLQPGEWVIVSRVVPELSEPRDKIYREARRIFGRYAATFFRVPDATSLLDLQAVLHQEVD